MSPVLFNMYTNDQPIHKDTQSFIYADDLCIAAQEDTFNKVETILTTALTAIGDYYIRNQLRANPDKTQTCAFHLRNREALCYSTAEYACPVWERSAHAYKVDPALNEACRSITGCLKPTNVENLYLLAGIAPPAIRRHTTAQHEREKQIDDDRHPLYGHTPAARRLKSRHSFIIITYSSIALISSSIRTCSVRCNTQRSPWSQSQPQPESQHGPPTYKQSLTSYWTSQRNPLQVVLHCLGQNGCA